MADYVTLQDAVDGLRADNQALTDEVLAGNTTATTAKADAEAARDAAELAETNAKQSEILSLQYKDSAEAAVPLAEQHKLDAEAQVPLAQAEKVAAEAARDSAVLTALGPDNDKLASIASVYSQPSLNLDFAKQSFWKQGQFPWNQETLDPATDLTFTRASTGTYFDAQGVLQTAAADEMRLDHDPVTGEPLGVLIEPSATNLVVNADILALPTSLNTGSRFADDAVVTAAIGVTDVSGGEGAFHASVPTPGFSRFGYANVLSGQEGMHTVSVFLRAVEGQSGYVTMRVGATTSNYTSVFIDDSRWYRAELNAEVPTSLSHFYICERRVEDSAVNNLDEFYFCFAQAEEGPVATSYIPTAGAAVTRAADRMTRTLGEEFNPSEFTVAVEMHIPDTWKFSPNRVLYTLSQWPGEGEGGTRPTLSVYNQWSVRSIDMGGTATVSGFGPVVGNVRSAIVFTQSELRSAVNGTSNTRAIGLSAAELGYLHLGAGSHAPYFNGNGEPRHIKSVRYYPYAMTAAELIEETS